MRLVNVPTFSFQNILEIDPSVDFGAGLTSESIPINMVTVELLAKAKYNSDDGGTFSPLPGGASANFTSSTGTLATMNRVVHLLVQQLLLTDVETLHLRIQDLLVGLLTAPHSNLSIWRRVLDDRDIYETFFWYVSSEPQCMPTSRRLPQSGILNLELSTGVAVLKIMRTNIEA